MKQIQEGWRILGIGLSVIFVLLFIFNSSEQINIGWFWVFSPLWILILGYFILRLIIMLFPHIRWYLKFKKKMKINIKEKWWEK